VCMMTSQPKEVSIKGKIPIAKATITITRGKGKPQETFSTNIPVSEVTTMFEDFIGDGKANISLTGNFGAMEYGKGYSIQLFTSITVNQDAATMELATHTLADFTMSMIKEIIPKAEDLYSELSGGK